MIFWAGYGRASLWRPWGMYPARPTSPLQRLSSPEDVASTFPLYLAASFNLKGFYLCLRETGLYLWVVWFRVRHRPVKTQQSIFFVSCARGYDTYRGGTMKLRYLCWRCKNLKASMAFIAWVVSWDLLECGRFDMFVISLHIMLSICMEIDFQHFYCMSLSKGPN